MAVLRMRIAAQNGRVRRNVTRTDALWKDAIHLTRFAADAVENPLFSKAIQEPRLPSQLVAGIRI